MRISRLAGVAGVALALVASLVGPAQAETVDSAATPLELRVISHNIAGGPTNGGALKALKGVIQQIEDENYRPHVVMLQEVCLSQFNMFKDRFPTWHVEFVEMLPNQDSCKDEGSEPQGQVLASPYPMSKVIPYELPGDDYVSGGRILKFKLLCGNVEIPGHATDGLRACVTHLRARNDPEDHAAREEQTAKIRSLLHYRIWDLGQAVVVGGDFNAHPNWNAMDNMYRLSRDSQYTGIGDFYEADQTDQKFFDHAAGTSVTCGPRACRTGEWTKDTRKLDYAFISRNVTHGGRVSGYAAGLYTSDHQLYRALFEIEY